MKSACTQLLAVIAFVCGISASELPKTEKLTKDAPPSGKEVVLRRGTPVVLVLFEDVKSGEQSTGETVQVSAYQDVWASNKIVINAGRPGSGKIKLARKSGVMGRPGKIQVEAITIQAVDKQFVRLIGETPVKEGKSRRLFAILASVIFSALITILIATVDSRSAFVAGAAIFAVCLFVFRGGQAQIKAGTEIHCKVASDVRINA